MSIIQYTQPLTPGDVLLSELRQISRDRATFQAGAAYVIGQVLGKVLLGAASAAIKSGGNTGNGAFTLDPATPILAHAKVGIYSVRATAAAANGGTFRVIDPDGHVLGDVAVGAVFANQIKFTIADGSVDFVVGDGFDVTIAAGSGAVGPLAPSALDGTQHAAAVSLSTLASSTGTQPGEVVARAAGVMSGHLAWPEDITDAQKATAIAELAAAGVIVRTNI